MYLASSGWYSPWRSWTLYFGALSLYGIPSAFWLWGKKGMESWGGLSTVGEVWGSRLAGGACAPVEALWAGPDPGARQGRGRAVGGTRLARPRERCWLIRGPSQLRHAAADDEVCGGEERSGQTHQPLRSAHRCHGQHGRCRALPVCGCSVHCTAQPPLLGLREDYHCPVSVAGGAVARTPDPPDPSLDNRENLGGAAAPPRLLPLPRDLPATSLLLPQGHGHSIQCGCSGYPSRRGAHSGHHPRGGQPAGSRHLFHLGRGLASVSVGLGFRGLLRGAPGEG